MGEPTAIKDIFDIPESVHQGDFVLRLSEGVEHPEVTLSNYVVTPQLVKCFDQAMKLIRNALSAKSRKGSYLHGSFGSGKSHFMAVLSLLLQRHTAARSIPELADIVSEHNEWTRDRNILLVPFHMIGAQSMEQAVLGGYARYIRERHPDAPTPPFFQATRLFEDAQRLREKLGDKKFFEGLGSNDKEDDGWGSLGSDWDAASFNEALAAAPEDSGRLRLVGDLVDSYFTNIRDLMIAGSESYTGLDEGLRIMADHAESLGYDAVVLFLDELVLWLASHAGDIEFLNRETQKVTKLVEAGDLRGIPIVSFIARQRDLRELVGEHIPGAEQMGFADGLQHSEARFERISLEDRNLPLIAQRRLLRPRTDEARKALDSAFNQSTAVNAAVLDTLLTRDGDKAMFRQVYPFSPALVQTLVALSSMLQRERTALKLMQQLLVNHRESLMLGDVVPVGDLFDVIAEGAEPFNEAMKVRFDDARRLWERKLRPMLEAEHGVAEDDLRGAHASSPQVQRFFNDARLLKTLVLSALADGVEALRALTPSRLAALNHGTVRAPIAGQEAQTVLTKLQRWAGTVGEIKISDNANPEISLQIVGVDTDAIIAAAQQFDNPGNRIRVIKNLVLDMLELPQSDDLHPRREHYRWRGSKRPFEVLFNNVRTLSDANLGGSGQCWRIIIDHPFDEGDWGPSDDVAHLNKYRERGNDAPTIAWLPSFLTHRAMGDLGRLVILEHLLSGQRLRENTSNLSESERDQARVLLGNQRQSLRQQLRNRLMTAYGVSRIDEEAIDESHSLDEHFQTLHSTLSLAPPTAPTMRGSMDQLLDQALEHQYPKHPKFTCEEVTTTKARQALELIEEAVNEPNGRVGTDRKRRDVVRDVAVPLDLGQCSEGAEYFAIGTDWCAHFDRLQARDKIDRICVADLRRWMEEPQPRGLMPHIQDLVTIAFALQTNRSFRLHGGPTPAEIGKLSDEMELVAEPLPDDETWEIARKRAASLFGINVSPALNANNVERLAEQIKNYVNERRDSLDVFIDMLSTYLERFKLVANEAARFRTALSARAFATSLVESETGTATAETLANASLVTSDAAVRDALARAGKLSDALNATRWQLFDQPKTPEAQELAAKVGETLQHDEHVTELALTLSALEQAQIALLQNQATPAVQPSRRPPASKSYTGHRRLPCSEAGAIIDELRSDIEANVDATIEIHWTIQKR